MGNRMTSIPQELSGMLQDLKHYGFRRVREVDYGMSAFRIEIESDNLRLAVSRDKFSRWGMEVAGIKSLDKSYDLALVISLLDGVCADTVSLADEVQFITRRLDAVTDLFSEQRRNVTHSRLHELALQRWEGRIAGL
jgi:hypothetical protein